ncbi:cellulose synthase/poly-beta-1,6-N-acetylglucosamine synthase-like glycosyltransferase [Rhizobium sp. PP-F2F-G48]|uniref:glycosyltransferase family 2 protein n=1 Tax=Rhizobium sp. PP-F2F-G48 TaxID=2135651 RepID=UPI001046CB43|nr:glycosyltransferase family 2 protein [Rhizobium sp. PP-F2F-G48]TCM56133.1 cellulose synthase/poly-beta-1,6-N-acetylglucosamine synthase-like glycosyltransferase [Rhizobium sp. PP-F2F-G48]
MRQPDYLSPPGLATRHERTVSEKLPLPAFSVDLLREGRLLLKLGIGKPTIARMMLQADENGTTVEEELLASGEIVDRLYFEAMADLLGLPFQAEIDADQVHDAERLDTQLVFPQMLRLYHSSRSPITVIVPTLERLGDIASTLDQRPALRQMLAVSTPAAVRKATWAAGRQRRVRDTLARLFDAAPIHSARIVFWGKQGFYTGLGLSLFVTSALLAPFAWLLVTHLLLTGLYFCQLFLRARALLRLKRPAIAPALPPPRAADPSAPLPVYSVFVALYREAEVVSQLIHALDRLDWPRSRLDIKLICEEDDGETLAALEALPLSSEYEIVRVPAALPRTKPKALSYALPGACGRFLTIYDAEDRPDPGQLCEAHAAFLTADPRVACLQAPLVVTNAGAGWLSTMFALEYSSLFRGLLPYLASRGLPLPLGGTSNHFRVDVLNAVGGWDPYNTTEDADLGMRLARLGYLSQMIQRPTFEDAPTETRVWFAQRTRWYKGWMQTWLVLMREPSRLARQMGWKAFATVQILVAGLILSALGHPLIIAFLAYLGWTLTAGDLSTGDTALASGLLLLDVLNLVGSYAIMIQLGCKPMQADERRAVGSKWRAVPLYWLMISAAAWAAIIELYRKPFAWNKTPHMPTAC